mmetsp:Transcript_26647/g.68655  ORF Transcript_26647/g.68655 Transcript_26647/m.68655 type:complete len:685 (+) Transcript_26647:445-2499(+)
MACPEYTNQFGLTQYDGQCAFFEGKPPLPEGLGWFVVIGLGAVFALSTVALVWLDSKYGGTNNNNSEDYNTAGHSMKTGLVACNVVSKWTWAATLLQSSNVAFKFGVSGPFWYAAGATVQVLLFSILAVEVKRKAPHAHTVLEIINVRWGKTAHLVYLFFTIVTNIIVTAMLVLGGAAVIEALSGVNIYAASMLIPIGVVAYTIQGGLRATFLAAWSHTALIYIALCTFCFLIYAKHEDLGSPAKVWENLNANAEKRPPEGNNMGASYLTMFSESGLIFGIINIIGNFGTVFVDQSYWQSAIAAQPQSTFKGYMVGGLCWFAIPFTMATSLGLAGRALDLPITITESNEGLVPPAVATHLMGKGGAFLLMLQLFLAVTSTGNSEQMAVASLFSYDVYRQYFNPQASNEKLLLVSRIMVGVYAVVSGVIAIILLEIGLNLGWVYLVMGIIIGSAVFPLAACITWKKCSAVAAVTSSLVGMPLAIMTWLVTAATLNDGVVDLDTTAQDYPMLAGNLVALVFSSILCIILSFIFPQDFDWNELQKIPVAHGKTEHEVLDHDTRMELNKIYSICIKTGAGLTFVLLVAWPCLALPAQVFGLGYFTFWVILSMIWGLIAAILCIFWPLYDARETIKCIIKQGILRQPPPSSPSSESGIDPDTSLSPALKAEIKKVEMLEASNPGVVAPQ